MIPRKSSKRSIAGSQQIGLFQVAEVPNTFRKAVQIVHSEPKAPMSMLQRKLSNVWLKNAVQTAPDPEGWWSIGVAEMMQHIDFDSKNSKYLYDSAHALMSIVFEWDVIAPSKNRSLWKASVLFPEVEIELGVIRYQISGQLKERVLNPEMYALLDLNIIRKLRRGPAIALYEFCIRFIKVTFSAVVEWEKLRNMIMGASADARSYEEYKYFKAKVLKPCIEEINSQTDIYIELLEPVKLGKKVHKLQFSIRYQNAETQSAIEQIDEKTLELVGEIINLGIPQTEAKKLGTKYSHDEITAALAYTKANAKSNPPAFFRSTLEKGWGLVEELPVKRSTEKEKLPLKNKVITPANNLEDAFAQQRRLDAVDYFKELNAAEASELVEKYNSEQTLKSLKVNLNGRTGQGAHSKFYTWLAIETWGEVTADMLLDFARTTFMNNKQ